MDEENGTWNFSDYLINLSFVILFPHKINIKQNSFFHELIIHFYMIDYNIF